MNSERVLTQKDIELNALHEAGHVVIACLFNNDNSKEGQLDFHVGFIELVTVSKKISKTYDSKSEGGLHLKANCVYIRNLIDNDALLSITLGGLCAVELNDSNRSLTSYDFSKCSELFRAREYSGDRKLAEGFFKLLSGFSTIDFDKYINYSIQTLMSFMNDNVIYDTILYIQKALLDKEDLTLTYKEISKLVLQSPIASEKEKHINKYFNARVQFLETIKIP